MNFTSKNITLSILAISFACGCIAGKNGKDGAEEGVSALAALMDSNAQSSSLFRNSDVLDFKSLCALADAAEKDMKTAETGSSGSENGKKKFEEASANFEMFKTLRDDKQVQLKNLYYSGNDPGREFIAQIVKGFTGADTKVNFDNKFHYTWFIPSMMVLGAASDPIKNEIKGSVEWMINQGKRLAGLETRRINDIGAAVEAFSGFVDTIKELHKQSDSSAMRAMSMRSDARGYLNDSDDASETGDGDDKALSQPVVYLCPFKLTGMLTVSDFLDEIEIQKTKYKKKHGELACLKRLEATVRAFMDILEKVRDADELIGQDWFPKVTSLASFIEGQYEIFKRLTSQKYENGGDSSDPYGSTKRHKGAGYGYGGGYGSSYRD
ncbi:hypothetical protein HOD08_03715 [bacterium]|nr:hypothetical protein [bacterium]